MVNVKLKNLILLVVIITIANACGTTKKSNTESKKPSNDTITDSNTYLISTKFGDMTVKLSDETPLHRDNFEKLVSDSFYNGTLFHRVIDGFMIQGGDPSSRNAQPGIQLGVGNVEYTIPPEFNPNLIHKKGAIAAARQSDGVNPKKESSGCQFYIVDGSKVSYDALQSLSKRKDMMKKRSLGNTVINDPANSQLRKKIFRARKMGLKDSLNFYGMIIQSKVDSLYSGNEFKYNQKQIAVYDSIGGTPALDMEYTVFGEVIDGLNIIDSIATQRKDKMNRPFDDIKMTIKKL